MELEGIVSRSFELAIDEVVRNVIEDKAGWKVESEVKDAIKDKAREIMNEPEMKDMLKESMKNWIRNA